MTQQETRGAPTPYFTMFGDPLAAPPEAGPTPCPRDFERAALKVFGDLSKTRAVAPSSKLLVRHAADIAVDLVRVGISARDAASHVRTRFALTAPEETAVETLLRAATERKRVRALSGVAIGWAEPQERGWIGRHDRWGTLPGTWSTADAAVEAVRRADVKGGV